MKHFFGKCEQIRKKLRIWSDLTHFHLTNVPLLYPLKTSENRRFSDVFKGYRSGTLVVNGLIQKSFMKIYFVLWMVSQKFSKEDHDHVRFYLFYLIDTWIHCAAFNIELLARDNDSLLQHLNWEKNSPNSKVKLELNASSRKSPTVIDSKAQQKQSLAGALQNRCSKISQYFTILHNILFIKKTLQHRYFSVNIAKFLKTAFFIEHLRWLLLAILFSTLYYYWEK